MQLPRQRLLAGRQRSDGCGEQRVRAALGQGDHPCLRERAYPATRSRPAEERLVRRGICDIKCRAVHRDHPPPPVPGPCRGGHRHRPAHPGEQHLQRVASQPLSCPGDRRGCRHPPRPAPATLTLKSLAQQPGDLFVTLDEEQTHREHEVDHHPGGSSRLRCSPRPVSAITSSNSRGGKARVNTPIAIRSDNRSPAGAFTCPALATPRPTTPRHLSHQHWA